MRKIPKKNIRFAANGTKKKRTLDEIIAMHSYEILKRLADEDPRISKKIEELALVCLIGVDLDEIAESVFHDLNSLEVEDVWKNSGRTIDGYVDPDELASEMFEEALQPYVDELLRCQKLVMHEEAKFHCMGILKGIYMFEKEGTAEFQDWVVDVPHETFMYLFEEWRKGSNSQNRKEMDEFVKRNFPIWHKDLKNKQN